MHFTYTFCNSVTSPIFRIIHDEGFSDKDIYGYAQVVYSNTIQSLIAILRAMNQLYIPYGNPHRKVDYKLHKHF